jgi:very-short-patch-repair endonuclease
MEYVIETKMVRGMLPSLPNSYKVDLADPSVKLAIEVDGASHKTRKWKFLDRRKTQVLEALGWFVLRFWNESVLEDTETVVAEIGSTISRLKGITTTLPKGF